VPVAGDGTVYREEARDKERMMQPRACLCGKPSITYVSYFNDGEEWENPFCAECLLKLIEHKNENPEDEEYKWSMTLWAPVEEI
jgi:hypothetical protein